MFIFGDESGWTGPDLLNKEQPVLAITTVAYSEAQALRLRRKFFPFQGENPLKHAELSDTDAGRKGILAFLRHVQDGQQAWVKSYVVQKRLALIGKLVDDWIEPALYDAGLDLYAGGGHIRLVRAFHWGLPRYLGGAGTERLLRRYQALVRQPNKAAVERFYSQVLARAYPAEAEPLLSLLRDSYERLGPETLADHMSRSELDVMAPVIVTLASLWNRDRGQERLELIYDSNSSLVSETRAWGVLQDPALHLPGMNYSRMPLVDRVGFEKDTACVSIQLADIVSGALAYFFRWVDVGRPEDEYARRLGEILIHFNVNSIWPADTYRPDSTIIAGDDAQDFINAVGRSLVSK